MPLVTAAVGRFDGSVTVLKPYEGENPAYRDIFPAPPPDGLLPTCAEAGILGALTGVIGSIQALEVLKLVAGIGEPLVGRLLLYDGLAPALRRDPLQAAEEPDRVFPPSVVLYADTIGNCHAGGDEFANRRSPQLACGARGQEPAVTKNNAVQDAGARAGGRRARQARRMVVVVPRSGALVGAAAVRVRPGAGPQLRCRNSPASAAEDRRRDEAASVSSACAARSATIDCVIDGDTFCVRRPQDPHRRHRRAGDASAALRVRGAARREATQPAARRF